MPRVTKPRPYEIMQAIKRAGISIDPLLGLRGYFALHRIYDRTTGNFKGVGWVVQVTTEKRTLQLALLDQDFPETYQSKLF